MNAERDNQGPVSGLPGGTPFPPSEGRVLDGVASVERYVRQMVADEALKIDPRAIVRISGV